MALSRRWSPRPSSAIADARMSTADRERYERDACGSSSRDHPVLRVVSQRRPAASPRVNLGFFGDWDC